MLLHLGLSAPCAFAGQVVNGDLITFEARNTGTDTAGPMEGLQVSVDITVLAGQNFLVRQSSGQDLASGVVIPAGETRKLIYKVVDSRTVTQTTVGGVTQSVKPEWRVRVLFKLERAANARGLPWDPSSWEKEVELELPEDVDNSDPTYIQLSRRTSFAGVEQTLYQFSPGSSAGSGDTLELSYEVSTDSYVTIQIYSWSGELIRTLLSNGLRTAGTAIDTWDGTDTSGELVGEGAYRFTITGVDAVDVTNTWVESGDIVVDNGAHGVTPQLSTEAPPAT